jgi:hypothetical protein
MVHATVLVWNVAWAAPSSARGETLLQKISGQNPDLAVFTEVRTDFLEHLEGHRVTSSPDYGYAAPPTRRKVAIWSRTPWSKVDLVGSESFPSGRYAAATTSSPVGEMRTLGVCIPWSHAHVTTGQKNRRPWEDHLAYTRALSATAASSHEMTLVAGDFNQRIPKQRQPVAAWESLSAVLDRMTCFTEGPLSPLSERSIDHVLGTPDLQCAEVKALSNFEHDLRLSDHIGIVCQVERERSG